MKCLELWRHLNLSVAFVFILIFSSFANTVKTGLNLKDIVYVNSRDVYIKDIATVSSQNKNLKKYISSIKVKTIYADKDRITKNDVLNALKQNYIDTTNVIINGKYTIVVLNKTRINEDFIKQILKNYIKSRYKNLDIEEIRTSKVSIDVVGKPKITISPKGQTNSYIYFDIFINRRKISASVKYYPVKKVVVAKRYIPKGSVISVYDVKLSKVKIKKDERYFTNVNEVIGRKVKFSIKANEPIKEKYIQKNFIVKRNTNVEVVFQRGSFKIKLLGRALENGQLGDLIKVRNLSSGKVILCRVIGQNRVKFVSGLR